MWKPIVFVGMETSGRFRRAFQALGHETYSCDLLPSEDRGEEMAFSPDGLPLGRHLVGDIFDCLDNLWSNDLWPELAIFHPDCTYLTISAAWAFKDGPYHMKIKPEILTGRARRGARDKQLEHVRRLMHLPIRRKVIENPIGAISSAIRKPTQIVQPYQFGDDASKGTCLWYLDKDANPARDLIIPVNPAQYVQPRLIEYRGKIVKRWANQAPCGAPHKPPALDRWKDRSRTFPGIANAGAAHWSRCISQEYDL